MTGYVIIKVAIAYWGIAYLLYSLLIPDKIKHFNPHNSSAKQVCLLHLQSPQMTHPTLLLVSLRNWKLLPKTMPSTQHTPLWSIVYQQGQLLSGFLLPYKAAFPGALLTTFLGFQGHPPRLVLNHHVLPLIVWSTLTLQTPVLPPKSHLHSRWAPGCRGEWSKLIVMSITCFLLTLQS